MRQGHSEIHREAIAWRLRLHDGNAADWEAFTAWLEQDPRRSAAYDDVALADAEIDVSAIPPHRAANDGAFAEAPRFGWSRTGRWAGAVAAVAVLVLLALAALPPFVPSSTRYEIATALGETRNVDIGDGSSAVLNGGTRLVLDHNDPRYADLASGEATFVVRHDPAHPFVLIAGEHRLQDAGTTFNVIRDQGRLAVEVIEGAVVFNPHREAVALHAGQTLQLAPAGGRALLGQRSPDSMAGWRRGQLSFRGAPLEIVAADLARSLGTPIAVDRGVAGMPFTGSIHVGTPEETVQGFASTLGLRARRVGEGWRIEPHSRAPR